LEQEESFSSYSRLVLQELVRLNENHERMRSDFDTRFNEINLKFSDIKNMEKNMFENKTWVDKVNEVWSPTQMKDAKDEIYRQKNRWVAAIAIITFIQILIGIIALVLGHFN
jgi:hypothetical protein